MQNERKKKKGAELSCAQFNELIASWCCCFFLFFVFFHFIIFIDLYRDTSLSFSVSEMCAALKSHRKKSVTKEEMTLNRIKCYIKCDFFFFFFFFCCCFCCCCFDHYSMYRIAYESINERKTYRKKNHRRFTR